MRRINCAFLFIDINFHFTTKMSLSENKSYGSVRNCYKNVGKTLKLVDLFASDPERFEKFTRKLNTADGQILIDFSKNLINEEIFAKLIELVFYHTFRNRQIIEFLYFKARNADVEKWRNAMFSGEKINFTETRYFTLCFKTLKEIYNTFLVLCYMWHCVIGQMRH